MYNVCKKHYPIFIIMHIFSYAIQTLCLFHCFIFLFNLLLFFLYCAPFLLLYHCLAPGNICILIVFQFLLLNKYIHGKSVVPTLAKFYICCTCRLYNLMSIELNIYRARAGLHHYRHFKVKGLGQFNS